MLFCCFLGHEEILEPGFEARLFALLRETATKEKEVHFYLPRRSDRFHQSCLKSIEACQKACPNTELLILSVKSSPEERPIPDGHPPFRDIWPYPVGHLKSPAAWEKHARRFCIKNSELVFSYLYPELEWTLLDDLELAAKRGCRILDLTSPVTRNRIDGLIAQLPEEERELLLLYRATRDLSFCAEHFKLKPKAAAAKVHAVLRKLKRAFVLEG